MKDLIDRFVDLTAKKKELSAKLDTLKKDLQVAEHEVLEMLERQGMASVKTKSGATVYMQRQVWARAKDGDKDRAAAALKHAGLTEFVSETFNTNTISAWFRECEREERPVPEEVAEAFQLDEVFSARVRGA